jgi:diguanylate cyclase (GGDEF)-like protein
MEASEASVSQPWQSASAPEIAQAAGAVDLFVFRRVAEKRFAHVGGAGQGAGWAGIVEIGADEEPLVSGLLAEGTVYRRVESKPWHVLGPYYGQAIAAVPVSSDVFVLFGASTDSFSAVSDAELLGLARHAGEALIDVAPAKRLADELEMLNAVRDLLQTSPETFDDVLQRLVDHATASLSCDLGFAYVAEGERVKISDHRGGPELAADDFAGVLAAIGDRSAFPICVQRATAAELPEPFRTEDGVLAYYLLEITQPLPGFLLLLHTTAGVTRGFTLLCQSLGRKLVDAAGPLLAAGLLRDSLRSELERAEAEARRDPLTGLANRLAWTEALASVSICPNSPTSVVKLDCRGLKWVNDTHGHQAGDRLLCRVAGILTASVRTGDLVARVGGDEFSILVCGGGEEDAKAIVSRIEVALQGEDWPEGPQIGLSIGASTTYGDPETAEETADSRMLEAKRLARRAEPSLSVR